VTGGVWVASYVLLWLAVVFLSVIVVALLRQVGVLHTRLQPLGVHPAGEGPEPGTPAPPTPRVDYASSAATLLAFTSPTCVICRDLRPSLAAVGEQYADVRVVEVGLDELQAPVFTAFSVRSTPYLVAVDRAGIVRGAGVANSLEQIEVLLGQALADA
jgi:thiol-disulfide isomerase/thioredoxin